MISAFNSTKGLSNFLRAPFRWTERTPARGSFFVKKLAYLITVFGALTLSSYGADWLQQGGPNRDAVVPPSVAGNLAGSFPDQKLSLLWETNVGFGVAPVVVSNGRIYTFGLYKPGTPPDRLSDPSSAPSITDLNSMRADQKDKAIKLHDIPGTPDWVIKEMGNFPDYIYRGDEYAQCLDAATGKMIWATKLTDWGVAYTGNCGWSTASPAIAGDKVVFHSANGQLYCLDRSDGKVNWKVNLWDHGMYNWSEKHANACGPLIVNDTVIVSYVGLTDARWKEVLAGQNRSDWSALSGPLLMLSGFDLQTGQYKWTCKPHMGGGFRTMNARIGYALIENNPTVLLSFGLGTYGVDPATGSLRWEYDIADDRDDAKGRRGLWAAYPSYAPVAWNNYVIDTVSNAHDDSDSRTWCIQITENKPKLVWESNEFVPYSEVEKSNVIAQEGKIYGSDAHGIWDTPGLPSEQRWLDDPKKPHGQPGRNHRDKSIGQFQCRDIATGKLIWSSNAMLPQLPKNDWRYTGSGPGPYEWYPTKSIISGDLLIANSFNGPWVARLKQDGLDILAKGISYGDVDVSEPVLVDGMLYVRNLSANYNQNTSILSCYYLRAK
jgi:outer membrane protein assembly factor BamB